MYTPLAIQQLSPRIKTTFSRTYWSNSKSRLIIDKQTMCIKSVSPIYVRGLGVYKISEHQNKSIIPIGVRCCNWDGVTKAITSNPLFSNFYPNFENMGYLLNTMFISAKCDRIYAVVAPVRYERDGRVVTDMFA